MPVYEYECLDQGHHFEVQQKMTDNPLESCKFCNSNVRRLISRSAFVLKGGGWYSDAYAKKPEAKAEKPEAPAKKDQGPDKTAPAKETKPSSPPAKEGGKKTSSDKPS